MRIFRLWQIRRGLGFIGLDGTCMSAGKTDFCLEEMAQRWFGLAERRLAYYQELYLSGRWTRYYPTEERFAARILDVVKAADVFRKIAAKAKVPPVPFSATTPRSANRNAIRTAA